MAIVDASAVTTDKLGLAPTVCVQFVPSRLQRQQQQQQQQQPILLTVGSWLHFVLVELLKNAMRATVEKAASLSLSRTDLPAIRLLWTIDGGRLYVRIIDEGIGMTPEAAERAFQLFSTSAAPPPITYTYSGNFGPSSHGHGVGLPLSRLLARCLGGDVSLLAAPSLGTTAHITISTHG
jgi:signal transduction histidine kinase